MLKWFMIGSINSDIIVVGLYILCKDPVTSHKAANSDFGEDP